MAKSIGSTKTAGSRTRNVPTPSQTPRPKTSPQHPVKHSAKATAPKISPGFKLGRLPPDLSSPKPGKKCLSGRPAVAPSSPANRPSAGPPAAPWQGKAARRDLVGDPDRQGPA